jgi:hypothetical protein
MYWLKLEQRPELIVKSFKTAGLFPFEPYKDRSKLLKIQNEVKNISWDEFIEGN